jgi:hypothetical protein
VITLAMLRDRHPLDAIHEARFGHARDSHAFVRIWRSANAYQALAFQLEGLKQLLQVQNMYGVGLVVIPALWLTKILPDGEPLELGLASVRLITTAAVNSITDGFQGLFTLSNWKYHGIGTGAAAEATGDTALGAEWAGADYTGGVRASGNQTEGASANIYHTEGTNTKASAGSANVTEHGVFTQAALAGGTLLDRSVFTAVPLAQNEGLLSKYEFTSNAGG